MEVLFDLRTVFGAEQPIAKISSEWVMMRSARKFPAVADVINALGEESATAQGLRGPVTSYDKLYNSDYTMYIWWEPHPTKPSYSVVFGFAKVGRKDLYIFDKDGKCVQCKPLCLLDFYVVGSQQRKGYGVRIFQHFMRDNGVKNAWEVAVDRPSIIFFAFAKRHFGLPKSAAMEQPNNFVVFSQFFDPNDEPGRSEAAPAPVVQPVATAAPAMFEPAGTSRHAYVRMPGDEETPSNYHMAKSRYLTNLHHSPAW